MISDDGNSDKKDRTELCQAQFKIVLAKSALLYVDFVFPEL